MGMRPEAKNPESLARTQNIEGLVSETHGRFVRTVTKLLAAKPNTNTELVDSDDYTHKYPSNAVHKSMGFKFGNSTVMVSLDKEHNGVVPTCELEITTPITIDEPPCDKNPDKNPREVVIFKSSKYSELNIEAKAFDEFQIIIDQYTAGGLLPPINPLGRGKIDAFERVIALFDGIDPHSPKHNFYHPSEG